jgi:hypothetical protein
MCKDFYGNDVGLDEACPKEGIYQPIFDREDNDDQDDDQNDD